MSELAKSKTFILFSIPSFWQGFGRGIDLGCTMDEFNDSKNEEEADYKALKGDWEMIGLDLEKAIENYKLHLIEAK
ncbi:MAG: hypothetical protein M3R36_05160 [Bacteroidota bacterium]|nr:hypothetical protein [Bacteroidota bacterium]